VTNDLVVEGALVGRDRLLHEEGKGFRVAMQTLDCGRIGIAAQALASRRQPTTWRASYAKQRYTFGKPIAEHQAIQTKLADMSTEIDAARLACRLPCRDAEGSRRPSDRGRCEGQALLRQRLRDARPVRRSRCSGGLRLTRRSSRSSATTRDAKITEIYEGTSEIQRS